jgi:hypothetical protein
LSKQRAGRAQRPERIPIPGDELVRNDIVARDEGVTERSLNRGDAQGDPYTFVGGVKYRPLRAHQEFRASRIIVQGRESPRRRRERMRG